MSDAKNEILELEDRRNLALGARDLEGLAETLADDYIHVYGGGKFSDKAGYISTIDNAPRTHDRSNLNVRVYGDAAVLTGDLLNTISEPGKPVRVTDAYVTQVAIKENGTWRFVSWQITPKK